MRILVLNADYPRFLSWLYSGQAGLGSTGYAAQMAARNASLFGVADFYSRNFAALGHSAAEIHVNNSWLQTAWAREHGLAMEQPLATAAGGRPQGWAEPPARRASREGAACPDRGFPAGPRAQSGHLLRRHQPDAAHQGDRQPDPVRTGRDRAVSRRGLDSLRPDDLATAHDREIASRSRRPRRSMPARIRAWYPRRFARAAHGRHRRLIRRHRLGRSSTTHRAPGGGCPALRPQTM